MKYFNITGYCHPDQHYMADMTRQLDKAEQYIENQSYFVINRARQYGKTTTLKLLKRRLDVSYHIFLISFEGITDPVFEHETAFCQRFYGLLYNNLKYGTVIGFPNAFINDIYGRMKLNNVDNNLFELSNFISEMCAQASKPIVLFIDEVDQAGNHDTFLSFLGMLRNKYLDRLEIPTFQSVVLTGVYDIINLKKKITNKQEQQLNSPWNIAAQFDVDMSFNIDDIKQMLTAYENDTNTGMDINTISRLIFDYTAGYPFLVSYICKILDEELPNTDHYQNRCEVWRKEGFLEAVRRLLAAKNTLFDSLMSKVENLPELKEILYSLLFNGTTIEYSHYHSAINLAAMFGFVVEQNKKMMIANRIFETWLYNYFLSATELRSHEIYLASLYDKSQFIADGTLNMKLVLEKFVLHFTEIFSGIDTKFLEDTGRRFFLLYLKPIINGSGNYYIESMTRDMGRTDIIVDYHQKQYIIEMKLWRGNEYKQRGEQQLIRYLENYNLEVGYMLSFNFNKKKKIGVSEIILGNKKIIEAVV